MFYRRRLARQLARNSQIRNPASAMLRDLRIQAAAIGLAGVFLCSTACRSISVAKSEAPSIIGMWLVKSPEALFPYHMFVFHSDGRMLQANPDAGDPNTSDSNGVGCGRQLPGGSRVSSLR